MRYLHGVLLTCCLTFTAQAQIASVVERAPTQSGKVVVWQEVVENHGSSAIVALHYTFERLVKTKDGQTLRNGFSDCWDILGESYSSVRAIPPGGTLEIPAQDPSEWSGGVDAVIFSDGHNEGDPEILNGMYQRRRGFYNGLTEAMELLGPIAEGGANPTNVADKVHLRIDPIRHDKTLSFDEQIGHAGLLEKLELMLRKQVSMAAPSDKMPWRQPTIDEVVKAKDVPREQAHAIVVLKKFEEWKAALEDNLEPPAAK